MRLLEIVGFTLSVLALLSLLEIIPASVGIALAAVSCGFLIVAARTLGPYWQLVPLYLAVCFELAALLSLRLGSSGRRAAVATAVTCLLIMTGAFTYVLPMFQLPKPSGVYQVGTRVVHLVDPSRVETHVAGSPRPREIMVQVWYPAAPDRQHLASYRRRQETTVLSSYMDVLRTHSHQDAPVPPNGGPFPVLLFNPAWKGQRTQNTFQTEDLASHGFFVVGIDHTYNSGPVAFPDNRVIWTADAHDITNFRQTTVEQQVAIGDREVRIQAGDNTLALDYLAAANSDPHSPWFHRVEVSNAGAFGHSFGGAVAAQTCYQDPRVKAAVNEDGWIFGDVATNGLAKPFLVMYEDEPPPTSAKLHSADVQTRRDAELNVRDALNVSRTMRHFGGYTLMIRGSRHNDFRDRSLYSPFRRLTESGPIAPRRAHEIVENYTLQFFSHYLRQEAAPLLTADGSPYKEVRFENWFAQNALTR